MRRRLLLTLLVTLSGAGLLGASGCSGGDTDPAARPSAGASTGASSSPSGPADNSARVCTDWRAAYQRTIGPDSTRYAEARKATDDAYAAQNNALGNRHGQVLDQLHGEWGTEATRLAAAADDPTLKNALAALGRYLSTYPAQGGVGQVDRRTALVKHTLAVLAACPDRTPLVNFPP